MNQRERGELDRHITGNYGEDYFKESHVNKEAQEVVDAIHAWARDPECKATFIEKATLMLLANIAASLDEIREFQRDYQ